MVHLFTNRKMTNGSVNTHAALFYPPSVSHIFSVTKIGNFNFVSQFHARLASRFLGAISVWCLLFVATNIFAQTAPVRVWDYSYGSTGTEYIGNLAACLDGGYIVVGEASVLNNDVENIGGSGTSGVDWWVIKTDANGIKQWTHRYGGTGTTERPTFVYATSDGGYLISGLSSSGISGDKTTSSVSDKTWVIKIDGTGNKLWEISLGALNSAAGLTELADGYIVGCSANGGSSTNKTLAQIGVKDYYIYKLNKTTGAILMEKIYGTTATASNDMKNVIKTSDGNLLLIGNSNGGIAGSRTTAQIGTVDFWILKVSSTGTVLWDYASNYNTTGASSPSSAVETIDGGYVVTGTSNSASSCWTIKLTSAGALSWSNLAGTSTTKPSSVIAEPDGGCMVSGSATAAWGTLKHYGTSGSDIFLIKYNAAGNTVWMQNYGSYGGAGQQYGYMVPASDGGYVLADYSSANSINYDVTSPTKGGNDIWIMKLGAVKNSNLGVTVSPATATANKGETVTYTVTVNNAGPDADTNVKIQVPLPGGKTFVSAVASQGSYAPDTKLWSIGSLANGASVTMTYTIQF